MKQMTYERCQKKTDHAQVKGADDCACGHVHYFNGIACCSHTHVMDTWNSKTKTPYERCNETQGGGGRFCSEKLNHRGGHVYQCGV